MKCPTVNKTLLPFKIHYFFKNGGGAFLTFLALMAYQRGISAKGVGVIWTVHPFVSALSNIAIGALADAYRIHRLLLAVLCAFLASSYTAYFFLPSIPGSSESPIAFSMSAQCEKDVSGNTYFNVCLREPISLSQNAVDFQCLYKEINMESTQNEKGDLQCITDDETKINFTINQLQMLIEKDINLNLTSAKPCIDMGLDNIAGLPDDSQLMSCEKTETFSCKYSCKAESPEEIPLTQLFKTAGFWLTGLCITSIYVTIDCSNSLVDTMCLTVLGENRHKYGKTRLFGAMGWGVMGFIMGSLVNAVSKGQDKTDYTPAMVITASFLFFNFLYTTTIKVEVPGKKKTDKDQAIKISCPLVSMLASGFIEGAAMGLIWTFEFIYIKSVALEWDPEFSDTNLLQGLCVGTDCFVGEMPFMFFSGYIIKKLSNIHTFSLTLMTMGVRLLFISFITNPWIFLMAHLLHGLSFGVFWANMVSFANYLAPLGSQATMQSTAVAFFTLGKASGAFVGGILLEKYGGSNAFFIIGIVVTAFATSHIIFHFVLKTCGNRQIQGGDTRGNYHLPVDQHKDEITLGTNAHPNTHETKEQGELKDSSA